MSNGRRRVPARLYRFRGSGTRTYKRRRFIRPRRGLPVNNRNTRYVARPLGNPLAITERKYHDTERAATVINTASPDFTPCSADPYTAVIPVYNPCTFNAIPVGTSWQQRIGRKVQIVSFKLKGEIGLNPQANASGDAFYAPTIRIIIFIDMQTNGAYPWSPNGVIYSGPTSILPISSFQNGDNFGRFKILHDMRTVLNPFAVHGEYATGESWLTSHVKLIDYTHNFYPPLTVHYNSANSATNADIVDNSIHMLACTDLSNPTCFLSYKARITFFDC